MAWIEVHQELRQHPKILRLAARLATEPATATGYIVNLWLWAAAYAQDGNLSDLTGSEIAVACDYRGPDTDAFLKALIHDGKRGLIDVRGDRKTIHDWKKHGLKLLLSDRDRVRKHRELKALEEDAKRYRAVTVTATIPNLTIPNPTTEEVARHVVEFWNRIAEEMGLAKVIATPPKRKAGIIARAQESAFNLQAIVDEIRASPFLRGDNDRGWKADFDFIFCSPNNYLKILEGKYRHGERQQRHTGPGRETITLGKVHELTSKARDLSHNR